ncbi:MAG: sugar-binding protein [Armatimonadota bacterium]|nr:sugar-binding protein [Armatimonadota bacterium]
MRMLTAVLLGVAVAVPAAAQDGVVNGSFEDGTSGWYRNHAYPAERAEVVARPDRGRCLRLTSQGETVDYAQRLDLETGREYVFQLDMKRSAAGKGIAAYVIVSRPNARDAYYSLGSRETTLNRWQHFARRVPVAGNASRCLLLLLNRLDGATAWFDEVQVVPLEDTGGPADGWCPKLRAPQVDEPPAIDGRLGEGEWAGAGHIAGLVIISDGSGPEAETEAWVCHDGLNLLVAARCEEPMMDQATSETTETDASGIFRDQVVEIFIDADNDHQTYYHLAVNSIGTRYDGSVGEGAVGGTAFDSGWSAAAAEGEKHWSVEASIPFASLAVAGSGDIWGFNICRERHLPDRREYSAWSATGSRFHAPHRFGDLVGLADVARPPATVSFLEVDDPTPGPAAMRFLVQSASDEAMEVTLRAEVGTPGGDVRMIERQTMVQPGADREVELPLQIDARGEWQVAASLLDREGAHPLCVAPTQTFIVAPILTARVVRPWYRGRIFSSMTLDAIEVEAQVAVRDPEAQGLRVIARLTGGGQTLQMAAAEATRRPTVVRLPAAELAEGRYAVDVQLCAADNEVLASVSDLPVEKLPPAETEIWFDRHNNMLINGEPHFPTGFYSMDYPHLADEVAAAGYTWYHTYASQRPGRLAPDSDWDWQRYLDAGAENGMRAFLGFGYRGDGEDGFFGRLMSGDAPEAERLMTEFIDRWKGHPGLGAWYLYDEPVISGRAPEEVRYLYEMADSRDPYHPKVLCQVGWSDPRFVRYLDVLMPDPYPIRADMAHPLTLVSRAVRSARRTVNDEKPVWAVLQWYGYEGGRFPTAGEMRCMAFLAVAAEAKGVIWYSFYHGYKRDRKQWPDMQRIGLELRACEDVVLAPKAKLQPGLAEDSPVETLLKRAGEGRLHLVAVNPEDRPLEDVRLVLGEGVASATDRLSGEAVEVEGQTLVLDFAPYHPMVVDVELQR